MYMDLNLFVLIYILFFIFSIKIGLFERKGLILINEGKYGLNLMKSLSKKFNWNFFIYPSIIFGYLGSFFMLYILIDSLFSKTASVSPVIPGVRIPGSEFYLPFWYGLLAIFLLLIIHETAHGVISYYYGVNVKSSGFGLLTILPFAFVKPEERKLNKLNSFKKVAIYSAGAFANILTAVIATLAIFSLSFYVSDQVEIDNLEVNYLIEDYPISSSELAVGDKITYLDNMPVNDYSKIFKSKKKGDSIIIETESGKTFDVNSVYIDEANPAKFGIGFKLNYDSSNIFISLILNLISFLYYFSILSIGVGLFNLLPLGPLDGGKMFYELSGKIFGKYYQNKVFIYVSLITFLLLIWSLLRPITQTFI